MKTIVIVLACLAVSAGLLFGVRIAPTATSGWAAWFAELAKAGVAVGLVSVAAYALRRRWRLFFGACEALIFFPTAMSFFFNLIQKSTSDVSDAWANWSNSTLVITGLVTVGFAGVRAIDDIGEGLWGNAKSVWDWLFEKPAPAQ